MEIQINKETEINKENVNQYGCNINIGEKQELYPSYLGLQATFNNDTNVEQNKLLTENAKKNIKDKEIFIAIKCKAAKDTDTKAGLKLFTRTVKTLIVLGKNAHTLAYDIVGRFMSKYAFIDGYYYCFLNPKKKKIDWVKPLFKDLQKHMFEFEKNEKFNFELSSSVDFGFITERKQIKAFDILSNALQQSNINVDFSIEKHHQNYIADTWDLSDSYAINWLNNQLVPLLLLLKTCKFSLDLKNEKLDEFLDEKVFMKGKNLKFMYVSLKKFDLPNIKVVKDLSNLGANYLEAEGTADFVCQETQISFKLKLANFINLFSCLTNIPE